MPVDANIISLAERRLDRRERVPIERSMEEQQYIARIISRMELCRAEQKTVDAYIDLVDSGDVVLRLGDGSAAPENSLAHLGDLLSNYERLLGEQLAALENEMQMLDAPYPGI